MPIIRKPAPGQLKADRMRMIYLRAEQQILKEITRKRNLGLVDYSDVAALQRVQQILRNMTTEAEEYAPVMIKMQFYGQEDFPSAPMGYENAGMLTTAQTAIVERLTENLMVDIETAAATAYESAENFLAFGRTEADRFRMLTLEEVAKLEAEGKGWNTIQIAMANNLYAQGITSFVDKAGRKWGLTQYCSMATRTTQRQAQVAAALTADDWDLWQISKIGSTCPLCSTYEGRVYSKSGTDPDYPPLTMAFGKMDPKGMNDLSNSYLNIHPSCLHSLIRYTTAGKSDEQIQRDKDFSSFEKRPANVDYRTKKQQEAYRKKEAERAAFRRDMKQFNKYKEALGNDFPKTFETFEKHKKAGDEVYKEWERKYRELGKKAESVQKELVKGNSTGTIFEEYTQNKATISQTLHNIENARVNRRTEQVTVLDRTGKTIFENNGGGNYVEIPDGIAKNYIITHNHPLGSCFSAADVETMVSQDALELRASTPRKTFYSLRKTVEDPNNKDFAQEYSHAMGYASTQAEIMRMIDAGELDIKDATIENYKAVQDRLSIDWLEKHASEYGYEFTRGDL